MKFPLRIYGEIRGLDPGRTASLSRLSGNVFHARGDTIEVEYEGPFLDIEHDLDAIVSALSEGGEGHVDCLDHDNWQVLRYRLKPGGWICKRVEVDSVLEPLLKE